MIQFGWRVHRDIIIKKFIILHHLRYTFVWIREMIRVDISTSRNRFIIIFKINLVMIIFDFKNPRILFWWLLCLWSNQDSSSIILLWPKYGSIKPNSLPTYLRFEVNTVPCYIQISPNELTKYLEALETAPCTPFALPKNASDLSIS